MFVMPRLTATRWWSRGNGRSSWPARDHGRLQRAEVVAITHAAGHYFVTVERLDGKRVHFSLHPSVCRAPNAFIRSLLDDTGLALSGIPEHPLSFRRWLRAIVEATEEEHNEAARSNS